MLLLVKLPAWHSSFHSGYQDSVEKYIPQLWLKQGKNTLIPSAVHSLGTRPLAVLSTYRTQWVLRRPLTPPCDEVLHLGVCRGRGQRTGRSGRFRHGCSDGEREVLPEGKTDQTGPHEGTEGAGGGISWWWRGISWWGISWWEGESAGRLLCGHTRAFSQMTEREESGGQEKEEPEMQRGSGMGHCLLQCLNVTDTLPGSELKMFGSFTISSEKMDLCWLITTI